MSMSRLLDNAALEWSSVVANSAMNRERGCTGRNSYTKELGLNPLEFLTQKLLRQSQVAWLDICCGRGNALLEAAAYFQTTIWAARVQIVGLDLVSMFTPGAEQFSHLQLVVGSVLAWKPAQQYDLITCVHGLHYIGDKLLLLQKAASWLATDGCLIGHLDMANLRLAGGTAAGKLLLKDLRQVGFEYNARRRLLHLQGQKQFALAYQYLGADDQAGPNYTGQPAVNSYYEKTCAA